MNWCLFFIATIAQKFATAGADKCVRVWDVATGEQEICYGPIGTKPVDMIVTVSWSDKIRAFTLDGRGVTIEGESKDDISITHLSQGAVSALTVSGGEFAVGTLEG